MEDSIDWVRGGSDYPAGLDALAHPPLHVRVRGRLPLGAPRIAIVGTRRADEEALAFTRSASEQFAAAGAVVISGGALGIDTAAHEGAVGTGRTFVVLPSGFAPSYPAANRGLFTRILEAGGGLASEAPDGSPPRRWTFLRRNELVAALVDLVLVVQAPRGSGALSTAAVARRLGKPVFVVPAAPWDPRGLGCVDLLARGARICATPSDVLSVTAPEASTSMSPGAAPRSSVRPVGLEGDELSVWLGLGVRPRHPDEIALSAGLPVERVQRALLGLLLSGRVDERDGGRYVTAPPKG